MIIFCGVLAKFIFGNGYSNELLGILNVSHLGKVMVCTASLPLKVQKKVLYWNGPIFLRYASYLLCTSLIDLYKGSVK